MDMNLDPDPIPLDDLLTLAKDEATIDTDILEDGPLALAISHPGRYPPKDLLRDYDDLLHTVLDAALPNGFTIDIAPTETCIVRNNPTDISC